MSSIRDTPIGALLRSLGLGGQLRYPEEIPGFLPKHHESCTSFHQGSIDRASVASSLEKQRLSAESGSDRPVLNSFRNRSSQSRTELHTATVRQDADVRSVVSGVDTHKVLEKTNTNKDVILVDWYDAEDMGNPRNWSPGRKAWVVFSVCLYTAVVYTGSAIFIPSDPYVMAKFGVSQELVSLGLSMYVAGYGLGPMFFSPISEIGYIGRNPPYVISFVFFMIVSILLGAVGDKSFAGLIVMRFLQGFFGSPILASGGASIEDVYDWDMAPYGFIFWIGAMYCGPALGPMLSAFAVPHYWRWPLWEIVLMSAPIALWTLPFMPETSHLKILYQRAQRLRKSTGNPNYRSKIEISKLNLMATFMDAQIKPLQIAILDPAIGFSCIYGGLLYATYYSFFESMDIVYVGIYGFDLGDFGLIFLCVVVGCVVFASIYAMYLRYFLNPEGRRTPGGLPFEKRFKPALPCVFLLPASLFMFAWTSRESIHWIVPTIAIALYSGTSFVIFQCIVCWLPLSYPRYTASLLAANDFTRSMLAVGFVQFSRPMYVNLGIGKGVSILGGLSVMGIFGMFVLYKYGAMLRARSKFTGA